ncbi:MAG: DUF3311 domain-containing protein [Bacillota bacterium]|nr:DUF3311 domain-containing protein [Bacillota bacterium]
MKSRRALWYWLLLLPALALMFPGAYARQDPELFGFPFFYWYQMAWIVLTGVLSGFVYLVTTEKGPTAGSGNCTRQGPSSEHLR